MCAGEGGGGQGRAAEGKSGQVRAGECQSAQECASVRTQECGEESNRRRHRDFNISTTENSSGQFVATDYGEFGTLMDRT